MPAYGLFLKYKFNDANGIFLPNKQPRQPDCRFWDQVIPDSVGGGLITLSSRMTQDPDNPAGPLIPVSTRINADTKTMELVARTHPPVVPNPADTDRVYFAVKFDGGGAPPVLNSISFSCGVNPTINFNATTVASPFRFGTEIQCLLTGHPGTKITSTSPSPPPGRRCLRCDWSLQPD